MAETREIPLALPSKGPLAEPARELLNQAGLRVHHPIYLNKRMFVIIHQFTAVGS